MAQGQIIYNDLSVQGALAMRDDITWGAGSASATKQLILASTGADVGLDIQTQGTGIIRVPTGYEANILSDSRAVTNRAYTDAHIAGKNLDATVTAPGAPQNNQAILWNQAGTKFTMGTVALGRVFRDGLTDDGTNVSLGGVTTVNVPNVVNAITGSMFFQANFGSGASPSGFKAQAVSAGVNNAQMFAGLAALDMTNTSMIVTANFSGAMQYAADYSANYTARTFTDLGYFQSHLVAKPATPLLVAPTGTEDGYVVYWNNVSGKFDLKAGASVGSIPDQTILGNISGVVAGPSALTGAQVNTVLPVFTSSLKGLTPASGGGTTNFLRADGNWAAVAGGVTSVTGTANQITAAPTTGAVVLTLPSLVAFPGTWTEGTLGYTDTGILWSAQSSVAGYNQVIVQNTNAGSTASVNYLVSNNSGTASTFYGEFGMNSSGFTGSGSWNIASAVYLDSVSSDLAIGTLGNNSLHFFTNSSTTDRLTIDGTGLSTFGGRVIVTSTATLPGLNVGSFAGDPSTLVNGDIWYNSTNQGIKVRGNSSSVFVNVSSPLSTVGAVMLAVGGSNGALSTNVNMQYTNGTSTFSTANATFTPPARSSSWAPIVVFNGATDTSKTAAAEFIDIDFNLARNVQWLAGTVATQRQVYVRGVTLTGASATATFTNAYSFYVDPPTAGTNATITNNWAAGFGGPVIINGILTVTSQNIKFLAGAAGNIGTYDSSSFVLVSNSTPRISINNTGGVVCNNNTFFSIAQIAQSGGGISSGFGFTAGALTNITAVETGDVGFNLSRTVQFTGSTGFATQRAISIQAPTYAFVSATGTITNAYTFYVDQAPITGTNAVITNAFAAYFGGKVQFTVANNSAAINLGNGSPGTFVDGDMWYSAGAPGFFIRQSAGTWGIMAAQGMSASQIPFSGAGNNFFNGSSNFTYNNTTGGLSVTGNNVASGIPVALTITGGAATGVTASETSDVKFNLSNVLTFTGSTGFALQRSVLIQARTYAFASATGTLTDVATLGITSAPIKGTNAAFTNTHGLLIGTANVGAATNSYGLTVNAMTGATNNYSAQFLGGIGVQFSQTSQSVSHDFISITQAAHTGGQVHGIVFNAGAHTNLTAVAESVDVIFALSRTVQFATGGSATQRAIAIQRPTYAFVGASTISDAITLEVSGAPLNGTNATFTNVHALRITATNYTSNVTTASGLTIISPQGATNNYALQTLKFAGSQTFSIDNNGFILGTIPALSSGWASALKLIPGAHTALTSATEFIDRDFSNATWTWVDGTTAIQRFNYFRGYTANKTTTSATFTDIYNVYIDASIAGSSVTFTNNWALGINGNLKIFDGFNIGFGTTTGTKLGTSTTQKIGIWNATPIVQPTTGIAAATFVANTSGTLNDTATWDGYTHGQVVKALRNIGILA